MKPLFGVAITPSVKEREAAFRHARATDRQGLDLITVMDHPYNPELFETWTLLTALGMATERVHLLGNVLSTPLRPPVMLAKQATTLDILTGGRLELGLGAGGSGQGIRAFGGPARPADQKVRAFKEVLEVIRGLLDHPGQPLTYEGEFHTLQEAVLGPAPAHRIALWTGAYGPRMLRLSGRLADGVIVSTTYLPHENAEKLAQFNDRIDTGAGEAGRPPEAVRRGYNVVGVLELDSSARARPTRPGLILGPPERWVETILELYRQRMDTFVFWPVRGDPLAQIEAFAGAVVPAVRQELGLTQEAA